MEKTKLGPQTLIYPMPAFLIGAKVNNEPNFMTIAWAGIANSDPPMVSIAIRHNRYSEKGIVQNLAFSINVPSTDMVRETDYCGLVSGAEVNKVEVCRFKVFYGQLDVPLIEQCPVNLECKVVHILDLGSHSLVIGKVMETYISENCLTHGKPDASKIRPFAYTITTPEQYMALGKAIGKVFGIGEELKSKK